MLLNAMILGSASYLGNDGYVPVLPAWIVGNLFAHDGIDNVTELSGAGGYRNAMTLTLGFQLVVVGSHRRIKSSALVRRKPQGAPEVGRTLFGDRFRLLPRTGAIGTRLSSSPHTSQWQVHL